MHSYTWSEPLKKAFIALYCSYAARYLTSFLSLPFLARVLGPAGLGDLAIMLSVAAAVAVWVEYGFGISALREVSSADPNHRGGILIGVIAAKLVLLGSVGLAFLIATVFFPETSRFPGNLGLVILLGGAQAFNIGWYFLGSGRATVSAILDAVASLMWFIPAFFIVRSPADVNLVIACQLAAQTILVVIGHAIALRELKSFSFDWRQVFDQVKSGLPLFIMRITSAVHTSAIVFILGTMAGAVQTGYFSAADRFSGTIIAFFYPSAQAIMPYLFSKNVKDNQDNLFSAFRYIFTILLLVSIFIAIVIYFSADLIINTFTGPQFHASIQVLKILSFTFPLVAITQAFGLYLMLPLRLDTGFVTGVLLGEGVSLGLTYIWAPTFGAAGAAAFRVVEAAITTVAFAVVLFNNQYMQKLPPRLPIGLHAKRSALLLFKFVRRRFPHTFGATG